MVHEATKNVKNIKEKAAEESKVIGDLSVAESGSEFQGKIIQKWPFSETRRVKVVKTLLFPL